MKYKIKSKRNTVRENLIKLHSHLITKLIMITTFIIFLNLLTCIVLK